MYIHIYIYVCVWGVISQSERERKVNAQIFKKLIVLFFKISIELAVNPLLSVVFQYAIILSKSALVTALLKHICGLHYS